MAPNKLGCGVEWFQLARLREHGNESLGSIKAVVDQMSDCHLCAKHLATRS
jgi:hypothetical protein